MNNFHLEEYKKIQGECRKHGATLIIASKSQALLEIKTAIQVGCTHFGENYIQEIQQKMPTFSDCTVHLIGHLQSKKAEEAVKFADVIHTIDRIKIAQKVEQACIKLNKSVQVFIQLNFGNETQKSGICEKELPQLIRYIQTECVHIQLIGLMCIPPKHEEARKHFKALKTLSNKHKLPHTSMGMSGDWKIALEEGATYIRVGSAIFGERL